MQRRLLVHCGLHKTGTTALQDFLADPPEDFARNGIFYPRSGRVGGGHHNLAWELARDRRFTRSNGDFSDLSAEIANTRDEVVISSEDFEGVLHRPDAIEKLRSLAGDHGLRLVLVFYLRNQIAYCESLFLELLRHGLGEECSLLALEAVETGRFRLKEWVFHFDYLAIADVLRSITDIDLVLRPYDRLPTGGIVEDFLSLVGIPSLPANYGNVPRLNKRDDTARSLALFHANRGGRCADGNAAAFLGALSERFAGQRIRLGKAIRDLFVQRFGPANRKLCIAGGLETDSLALSHEDEHGWVRMERLFSFEVSDAAHTALADPAMREDQINALANWCREAG